MADLEKSIEQAISDFDDIEKAIEEQGVNVPYDTDTSEYGNLIRMIPQSGATTQPPLVFTSTIDIFADGGILVNSFEDYDNIVEAFNSGRIVVAQTTLTDVDYEGIAFKERTATLICSGKKGLEMVGGFEKIPYVFQGVTTLNEIVTIECKKRMSTNGWDVSIQQIADAQDVDDLKSNIEQAAQSYFKFIEGYEDKIDSYTGAMESGTLYKINPPQDTISMHWNAYYIFAKRDEHDNLFQIKFFENANGIYFRTGTYTDIFSAPTWNEWVRTILSNEIDRDPVENSLNLITSGGVYKALQNIPSGGGGEAAAQPPYVFYASVNIYPPKDTIVSGFDITKTTEAFNNGRMVIANTQIVYWNENGETEEIKTANLIGTSGSSFFGVANGSDHVFIENHGDGWVCYINEAISKHYVDTAIGDIEASLENIINKYGLGGEM